MDDQGNLFGLDHDLALMKAPDFDRYELWLRDWLTTVNGPNPASAISVEFDLIDFPEGDAKPVCRVGVPPSPVPVYLRAKKGEAPQFWVRAGNSSRQLPVDAAAEYVGNHWPISVFRAIAAHGKALLRGAAN